MALIKIPTRNDLGFYSIRVVLDGVIYILNFRYNSRYDRWVMDLLDNEETPIAEGTPLQTGIVLLHGIITPELPPGYFMVLNNVDDDSDPTEEELGEAINLYYQEAS